MEIFWDLLYGQYKRIKYVITEASPAVTSGGSPPIKTLREYFPLSGRLCGTKSGTATWLSSLPELQMFFICDPVHGNFLCLKLNTYFWISIILWTANHYVNFFEIQPKYSNDEFIWFLVMLKYDIWNIRSLQQIRKTVIILKITLFWTRKKIRWCKRCLEITAKPYNQAKCVGSC